MTRLLLPLLLLLSLISTPAWAASWTFGESTTCTSDGVSTTVACGPINVANGSFVGMCVKSEAAAAVIDSFTGSDTLTLLTAQRHSSNVPYARCGYILAATGNATYSITATHNVNAEYKHGVLFEFTYSGTASADGQSASSAEDDNDATPTSNTITPTGTDELCVAFHADSTAQNFSLQTINGVAATTNAVNMSDASWFYKTFDATFTNGAASLTRDSIVDREWVQQLMCFKTTGARRHSMPLFLGE